MMKELSSFPSISIPEFDDACEELCRIYTLHSQLQNEWLSADVMRNNGSKYLKIIKLLSAAAPSERTGDTRLEEDEFDEDDEEALDQLRSHQVTVEYDIVLSPSYQVPVLYSNIKDPSYRSPPTMDTLYRHLIPPHFKAQVENVGVIGGVTITDHPITNSPAFFIHPCQTAAILESSSTKKGLTSVEYLMLWIGAMGKSVGLNVPISLAQKVN